MSAHVARPFSAASPEALNKSFHDLTVSIAEPFFVPLKLTFQSPPVSDTPAIYCLILSSKHVVSIFSLVTFKPPILLQR